MSDPYAARKVSWRKLSVEEVDRDHAFVEPEDYSRIRDFAASRSLVVLTGPAGVGKYAAALHLLTEETGRRLVHVLCPDTGLAELTAESLPKGTGLILQDLTEAAGAKLGGFELRRLIAAVEEADQKLIITAPGTLVWPDAEISKYCVHLGARADPARVVERQLRFQLGTARAGRAAALLGHLDVSNLIQEEADRGRPLRDLAVLAELLAKATGDVAAAAAAARAGLPDHSEVEFASRFEGR